MNPGDVFVTDPLDAVATEAVQEQGGTLQGFRSADLDLRELFLQILARANRAALPVAEI